VESQPVKGITLHHLGECVAGGLWLEEHGSRRPLEPMGYVHALD
jgi:thiamine-monophosphate kinase